MIRIFSKVFSSVDIKILTANLMLVRHFYSKWTRIVLMFLFSFAEETNYQLAYYVSDGFLIVSAFTVFLFLEIKVEKHRQNVFRAFKRILNPATGAFLIIMLIVGIGHGIFLNYLTIFLTEELNASSAMIGKTNHEKGYPDLAIKKCKRNGMNT